MYNITSYSLHEPKYNDQSSINPMDDLPLLFIAELLIFISIVESLAFALFQVLAIVFLELQVRNRFRIDVCHVARAFRVGVRSGVV